METLEKSFELDVNINPKDKNKKEDFSHTPDPEIEEE